MKFSLINEQIQNFDGDCVVVFLNAKTTFNNVAIQQLIELNNFESKAGSTLLLNLVDDFKAKQIIVAGMGDMPNTAKNYIKTLTAINEALNSIKAKI
jgi:hypothetical protein